LYKYRSCTRRRQSCPGGCSRSDGGTDARDGHTAGELKYAIGCPRSAGPTGSTRRRRHAFDSTTSGKSAGTGKRTIAGSRSAGPAGSTCRSPTRGNACTGDTFATRSARCRTDRVCGTAAGSGGYCLRLNRAGTDQSAAGSDPARAGSTHNDCRADDFKFGEWFFCSCATTLRQ